MTLQELQSSAAFYKERFSLILKDIPGIKGYLVFALAGRQTGIGSSPDEIIQAIPAMVVENEAADALRKHLKERPDKEEKKSVQAAWEARLRDLGPEIQYHPHIQVEVRFDRLIYEKIWEMQKHPLVDQELTPQTRASIRIVLGKAGWMKLYDAKA